MKILLMIIGFLFISILALVSLIMLGIIVTSKIISELHSSDDSDRDYI